MANTRTESSRSVSLDAFHFDPMAATPVLLEPYKCQLPKEMAAVEVSVTLSLCLVMVGASMAGTPRAS